MATSHGIDDYLETIYFLAFPIGEYRPAPAGSSQTIAARVAEMLGVSRASAGEMLKRLEAEGLFKLERKRPLPARPRRVGVITSPTGAAWHDVQTVCLRRDPSEELIFAPAQVQGVGAVESMIAALDGLAQLRDLDAIIIARGGGATEDLSPFNDEALIRAVSRTARPVCSGVGHESDVTLVDLVADVRAPTPSVAAELVVPDASADVATIARLRRRIDARVRDIAGDRRRRSLSAMRLLERRAPAARIAELRLRSEAAALRAGEQARLRMRDGRAGVRVESVEVGDGRS